jgi:hypothetical protein
MTRAATGTVGRNAGASWTMNAEIVHSKRVASVHCNVTADRS